jgi:hypothetical protein
MSDQPTTELFTFPAQIVQRATTAELLAVAKSRAPDPAIFDEYQPYFWSSQISNNRLDSYWTKMRPSTLKNFADEATVGVAFQDSHKTDSLARTLGQSLAGRYTGPGGDGIAHTDADFYTLTGLDPIIDTFVRKVRGAIVRDNSVGFHGGQLICSICGKDMMRDFSCWHWPGFEYVVTEDGKKTDKKVLAIGEYEDAHLAEVSAVYDGATPGAMIIKAHREIEAGRLKPEQVLMLEQRYRIHLPSTNHMHPAVSMKEPIMPGSDDERAAPENDPGQRAIATLASLRALFGSETTDDGLVTRVRELQTENARLAPLAKDGETYRGDLVTQALAEGARACGESFDADTYRGILDSAPIATVKRMRDDWTIIGNKQFPGGRATVDEDEQGDRQQRESSNKNGVPDEAYKTRR